MTHEEKKTAKIVEELTMYFFALGATEIDSRIEKKEGQAVITFASDYDGRYAGKLKKLDQYLNGQKNDGMEDIYWGLAGSGDPGESSQLLLLGMMVKRAEIKIEEKTVRLKLYKPL